MLKQDLGTFFCIDYYLKSEEQQVEEQITYAIKKWIALGFAQEEAYEWARVIENEDTPASISELFFDIKDATKCLPLIHPQTGITTCLYGFTKLSLERILNCNLKPLLMSWQDPEQADRNWEFGKKYIGKFPANDVIQKLNPKL